MDLKAGVRGAAIAAASFAVGNALGVTSTAAGAFLYQQASRAFIHVVSGGKLDHEYLSSTFYDIALNTGIQIGINLAQRAAANLKENVESTVGGTASVQNGEKFANGGGTKAYEHAAAPPLPGRKPSLGNPVPIPGPKPPAPYRFLREASNEAKRNNLNLVDMIGGGVSEVIGLLPDKSTPAGQILKALDVSALKNLGITTAAVNYAADTSGTNLYRLVVSVVDGYSFLIPGNAKILTEAYTTGHYIGETAVELTAPLLVAVICEIK